MLCGKVRGAKAVYGESKGSVPVGTGFEVGVVVVGVEKAGGRSLFLGLSDLCAEKPHAKPASEPGPDYFFRGSALSLSLFSSTTTQQRPLCMAVISTW